jgi:four helix bundle protein
MTNVETNPNDEVQMTKEVRMTNYRRRRAKDQGNWRGEEFWVATNGTRAVELRETASDGKPVYDLEERTARFGEAIIRFAKKIPQNPVNNRLIEQLVGAGTSVGANYCEADDGVSRKDFKNKIGTCRKEARETKFFLRMVATAEPSLKTEARILWQEAKELHLIFSKIWRK